MDLPTAQLTGLSPACDSYETLTKTRATNTKWLEWASDNDGNRDDWDLETRAVTSNKGDINNKSLTIKRRTITECDFIV